MPNKTLKTDLCVIGAGSGGLSVAAAAIQMGASVILIERHKMGGDCLNYGCVPSKSLLAASKLSQAFQSSEPFGLTYNTLDVDFSKVKQHIRDVIKKIEPNDSVDRFERLGVNVILGSARFINPKELIVNDTKIKARRFVIATGSRPRIPEIVGLDTCFFYTNETIFDLEEKPSHLIIIGGGPIGCEMAQAHRLLGCKVTQFARHTLLPRDDKELVSTLREQFIKEGIQLFENTSVDKVEPNSNGLIVYYEKDGKEDSIEGSHLLIATGRTPNTEDLNLKEADIEYSDRGIITDQRLRTSNKRCFAIGDVNGLHLFTHTANYHAGIVIKNALFRLPSKINLSAIPWVTYTEPEVAHVGLSEAEASIQHKKIQILKWPYKENDRALSENKANGMIKVIVNKKGYILGASIVGHNAGELLYPWCLAIRKKLKISAIADMIIPYPTLSEINKRVAGSFYTPLLYSDKVRRIVRWLNRLG